MQICDAIANLHENTDTEKGKRKEKPCRFAMASQICTVLLPQVQQLTCNLAWDLTSRVLKLGAFLTSRS